MTSPKEKCFEEATRKYEAATGTDLECEFEQGWRLMNNGKWEQGSSFFSCVNSFNNGKAKQVRRPDLTIGGNTVIDFKFTRPSGGTDDWSTRPGAGNKELQKYDYNQINKQNNPEFHKKNKNPRLDSTICQCEKRGTSGISTAEANEIAPPKPPQGGAAAGGTA